MHEKELDQLHILLVEDDRSHREFVADILEKIGCRVMIAFNGKDAMPFVRSNHFDIILMDIEMPSMDGIETARQLKEMKRHGEIAQDIAIVAITSNHDRNIEQECRDAGMAGLIPKHIWKPKWEPTIREKLLEVLQQAKAS